MADTEIMLQVTNVKKTTKKDSLDDSETYYTTKFKATNTDKVQWFKAKTDEKIAEPEDTFSLRELATQHTLAEVVENDVESEMEDDN